MPDFFDTHCHIQSSQIMHGDGAEASTRKLWDKAGYPDAEELINRAHEAGVTRMVCVGCSLSDSQLAVEFVQELPGVWASIGIHPHEAKDYAGKPDLQQEFADLITDPKVVAVGECGLDYFYGHSPETAQAEILKFQIELALEHDKPMIFHVREAFDDFWPIFEQYPGIKGVLHSFTDNQANMERAVSRGLYIGVNGIATFTKDEKQLDMYKSIPLSSLLLETDAPFLTPSPYRGKICEPYHTSVTAEFLAHLRGEDISDLAAATTRNANKLFGV